MFILVQLTFWAFSLFGGLLEKSVSEINNRYAGGTLHKLVDKVNSQSEDGAIRYRFYRSVLADSQIEDILIVIEYSSSGEVFSYNCMVIGYNKNGMLMRLDYSFYSNQEKIKVKRIKNISILKQEISSIKSIEYDDEDKVPFPSDMILLSYIDAKSGWQFRVSETPTRQVTKVLSLK